MSQSLYSFENISTLLSRAGVSEGRKANVFKAQLSPAIPSTPDLVSAVQAVEPPSQRALGAALESLLGDLSRVLGVPLFLADGNGLLLAGKGDAPTLAASIAAELMHSLHKRTGHSANRLDGILLSVPPGHYLVFAREESKRSFVIGAKINETLPLQALRMAAERIWETLFMRIQHA